MGGRVYVIGPLLYTFGVENCPVLSLLVVATDGVTVVVDK